MGCRHPVQQAGIGGIATPRLAIAVARAGGLGMLSGTGGAAHLAAHGTTGLLPLLDEVRVAVDVPGPVEARALYAGQGVGTLRARRTAAEIVDDLVRDAEPRLPAG